MDGRVIKFRFWHQKAAPGCRYADTGLTSLGVNDAIRLALEDGYVIEQFTGLHDKNGAEIYEGDFIDAPGHCGVTVVRYGGAFGAAFTGGTFLLGVIDESDICVIGNVHETPELVDGRT